MTYYKVTHKFHKLTVWIFELQSWTNWTALKCSNGSVRGVNHNAKLIGMDLTKLFLIDNWNYTELSEEEMFLEML